jgi:hypothetical protein
LADRRRNWVVIAGLVRDEAIFARQLEVLVDWRKKQLIEGIVYSTWIRACLQLGDSQISN